MRYAIVDGGLVVNVAMANEPQGDNWIVSDVAEVGWVQDAETLELSAPPAPPAPVWEWYIDPGSFYDRFGVAKMAVLTSTHPQVQAVRADLSGRHWVDLKLETVAQGLALIGSIVPEVTPDLQAEILTAPVNPEENLALRKMFFA